MGLFISLRMTTQTGNYRFESLGVSAIIRGMSKPKLERNKRLVALRDKDPKKYSFSKLAEIFNISRVWAYAVYMREKEGKKRR